MKRSLGSIFVAFIAILVLLAMPAGFATAGLFGSDDDSSATKSGGDVPRPSAVMPRCDKPLATVRFVGEQSPFGEDRSIASKMEMLAKKSGCLVAIVPSADVPDFVANVATGVDTKRARNAVNNARAAAASWRWVPIISRIGGRAAFEDAMRDYGVDHTVNIVLFPVGKETEAVDISAKGSFDNIDEVFLSAFEQLVAQVRMLKN